MVTVHDPICTDQGDLASALYGSFLPVPSNHHFPLLDPSLSQDLPGAIIPKNERVSINPRRECIKLTVTNNGDRPIQVIPPLLPLPRSRNQVGSHYHFAEANKLLAFDRVKALHKHLHIPSGTAVRFEPGESKPVTLCSIGGKKIPQGGNLFSAIIARELLNSKDGSVDPDKLKQFAHVPEPDAVCHYEHKDLSREEYISMYGPTVGDRVRLGDTSLWIEVERDTVSPAPRLIPEPPPRSSFSPCTETKSSSAEVTPPHLLSFSIP